MRCSLVFVQRHVRNSSLSVAFVCAVLSGATLLSVSARPAHATGAAISASERTNAWSQNGQLQNQAIEAMAVLARAPEHGLPAERYALLQLKKLSKQIRNFRHSAQAERRFNELLTAAIETYAVDLLQGLQPKAFKNKEDPKYRAAGRETMQSQLQAAVLKGLHRSITTNRVTKFLTSIEPRHPDYKKLQEALAAHRAIASRGGWPEFPRNKSGKMLKPGDVDPRVKILRERLAITAAFDPRRPLTHVATAPVRNYNAYSPSTRYDSDHFYDAEMVSAVRAFQLRHGLKDDGNVGKTTRAALNVSAADRVRQLELNLDRWRLMPKVMPTNHIWVNVPEYQLSLQIDREEVLDMRVVVGKDTSPTVMMHDQLDHIVFNPYWYPTRNITMREILPAVKADPNYLVEHSFDVLDNKQPIDPNQIDWANVTPQNFKYRFRQRPGSANSLGEVKFMFPNRYSIYLHDTNAKSLFNNTERALSHGCVRLEKPDALAAAVLEWDRGWNPQNVSQAMTGSTQKYLKLRQTLPVYLVYFTASVDNDTVYFHRDIYGHDAHHTAAQNETTPTLVARLLARYADDPSKNQRDQSASATLPPAAAQQGAAQNSG